MNVYYSGLGMDLIFLNFPDRRHIGTKTFAIVMNDIADPYSIRIRVIYYIYKVYNSSGTVHTLLRSKRSIIIFIRIFFFRSLIFCPSGIINLWSKVLMLFTNIIPVCHNFIRIK